MAENGLCVRLPLVNVTTGALRYELPRDTEGIYVHNVYVRRAAFPDVTREEDYPQAVIVTVEPAPAEE